MFCYLQLKTCRRASQELLPHLGERLSDTEWLLSLGGWHWAELSEDKERWKIHLAKEANLCENVILTGQVGEQASNQNYWCVNCDENFHCLIAHTSETSPSEEAPGLTWRCFRVSGHPFALRVGWPQVQIHWRRTYELPGCSHWHACSMGTETASRSCCVVLWVCFPTCISHLDMFRDRTVFRDSNNR